MSHRAKVLTSAARISVRWYPNVRSTDASRPAIHIATSAMTMAAASVSMCPASASNARLPDTSPPMISATM